VTTPVGVALMLTGSNSNHTRCMNPHGHHGSLRASLGSCAAMTPLVLPCLLPGRFSHTCQSPSGTSLSTTGQPARQLGKQEPSSHRRSSSSSPAVSSSGCVIGSLMWTSPPCCTRQWLKSPSRQLSCRCAYNMAHTGCTANIQHSVFLACIRWRTRTQLRACLSGRCRHQAPACCTCLPAWHGFLLPS